MSNISCNVTKLTELREKFSYLTDDLKEETNKLSKEIENLNEVLSTPKGDEYVRLFNEFIFNEKRKLENNNNVVLQNFNFAIKEYSDFLNDVNEMVGKNEQ